MNWKDGITSCIKQGEMSKLLSVSRLSRSCRPYLQSIILPKPYRECNVHTSSSVYWTGRTTGPPSLVGSSSACGEVYMAYTRAFSYLCIITSPNSALKKFSWSYIFCIAVCKYLCVCSAGSLLEHRGFPLLQCPDRTSGSTQSSPPLQK